MRWLLIVTLLTGVLPVVQAAGTPQAREEWMAGFVKLEEGGKAEDAGRTAAAVEFYQGALAIFREVQRKYPAWNPSLLTYRITFCEERIAGLQARLGDDTTTMKKADLEEVVRAQVAKIHELAEKNQRLTTDLASTSDALERARREAAQSVGRDTDIRELVKERKGLQDRLAAMTADNTRLTEAVRTLEEKGGLKALTERLQVELDQVKASKAEFEKGYETYKKAWENVKKRLQEAIDAREKAVEYVGQLRERTIAAEQQATASAEALAQAQREAQALKTAREQAEAEARTQAAEAAATAVRLETMRQENEQLRRYRDESVKQDGQVAELEKQVRELATAKAAAVAQAEGLRADVEKSVAVAANLERELAAARVALAEREAATKQSSAELEAELARQRATVTAQAAQVADLTQQLARAATERDERAAESQRAAAQWEADRKQLLAASASATTAGSEIKKLQTERDQLTQQVRELTALAEQVKEQPGLVAQLAAARQREDELGTALTQAKQDLAKAATEKTALEEAVQQGAAQALALQAAQDRLAAAQAAADVVEARLAEAERKLAATEDVVASQKRLLATGEERSKEMASLGNQLREREARIETVQQELADLRKQLSEAQKVTAKTTEEARTNGMEAARLRSRLEQAEKRAVALDEQLAAQQRARTAVDSQANAERVKEAAKLVEALEAESARLKAKGAEQLDLLRGQEKAIAGLEQAKATLAKDLAARDGEIARLKEDQKLLAAKTEVTNGLAASLSDADEQLAAAKRDLQRAQNERDQAQNAAAELNARLETARTEVARTRDLLAKQATPGTAGDLFREQIRRLTIQLEKESQRRRTLEELLSKGQDVPAVEPPVASSEPSALPAPLDRLPGYEGATFPEAAERDRRERQRQLLVRGYLRQGVAAEQAGNTEAARWNYGKVLENEPENRLATQRLGLIAAELGDDREAISFLKRAFRLDPDNLDVLLPLGFALVRQTEPDLAVSMLSRAVALEPDNPHAHRCLGIACSTLGWYDAAEVQFRRTDQLNPQDAENAFNLAVLLVTRQPPRTEEAKTWYLKARKLGAAADPGLDQVFELKPDDKP